MKKTILTILAAIFLTGCIATSSLAPIIQKTYAVVDSAAQVLQGLDNAALECPQMEPYLQKVDSVENALVKARDVLKKVAGVMKIEIPASGLAATNNLETLVFELEVEAEKLIRE